MKKEIEDWAESIVNRPVNGFFSLTESVARANFAIVNFHLAYMCLFLNSFLPKPKKMV